MQSTDFRNVTKNHLQKDAELQITFLTNEVSFLGGLLSKIAIWYIVACPSGVSRDIILLIYLPWEGVKNK